MPREKPAPASSPNNEASPNRRRFSITLSMRDAALFEELTELTDAYTESEVFRNAVRFHHKMIKGKEKE